jgi:phosphopantetheine--protein transferase-like protein
VRVGVDLLSVSRFARIAAHPRYRRLVFTAAELAQAGEIGSRRSAERLAGRFCVKEATCKVLGRGFGQGVRWRDIEVVGDRFGAPGVTLHGGAREAADQAGIGEIAVSLTHQLDLVAAVAAAGPAAASPAAWGADVAALLAGELAARLSGADGPRGPGAGGHPGTG